MEVAVHGYTHPFLEQLPANICTLEVLKDRATLEEDFDCIVRGMAYPYGTYNDQVVEVLKQCGIAYARTVQCTQGFEIPNDWLRMPGTCHHNDPKLMELACTFVESKIRRAMLFYLWGHSYEFEADDNWHVIETFAEYIGNRDDIWYATNIEIYDYVTAYRKLQFSTLGDKVHNPTGTDLYFEKDNLVYCVLSGKTITC